MPTKARSSTCTHSWPHLLVSRGRDSTLPLLACSDLHSSLGMWRLAGSSLRAAVRMCMDSPALAQTATRRGPLPPQHPPQHFHFAGSGGPNPAAEALSSVAWLIVQSAQATRCCPQTLCTAAAGSAGCWRGQCGHMCCTGLPAVKQSDQRRDGSAMPCQHCHMVTMPLHLCDLAEWQLRSR